MWPLLYVIQNMILIYNVSSQNCWDQYLDQLKAYYDIGQINPEYYLGVGQNNKAAQSRAAIRN